MKSLEFAFEINWPLEPGFIGVFFLYFLTVSVPQCCRRQKICTRVSTVEERCLGPWTWTAEYSWEGQENPFFLCTEEHQSSKKIFSLASHEHSTPFLYSPYSRRVYLKIFMYIPIAYYNNIKVEYVPTSWTTWVHKVVVHSFLQRILFILH